MVRRSRRGRRHAEVYRARQRNSAVQLVATVIALVALLVFSTQLATSTASCYGSLASDGVAQEPVEPRPSSTRVRINVAPTSTPESPRGEPTKTEPK